MMLNSVSKYANKTALVSYEGKTWTYQEYFR